MESQPKKSRSGGGDNPDNMELTIIDDGMLEIIPNPNLPLQSSAGAAVSVSDGGQELNVGNVVKTCNNEGQILLEGAAKSNSSNHVPPPQQRHPLQNQLVIANIGKYLTSSQDLMSARAVCKEWAKVLKPYQTVHLTNKNYFSSNISDFLVHQSNEPSVVQFANYHIHLRFSFDENSELLNLFQQYGEYVKVLTIVMDQNVDFTLYHFRCYILNLTPNLVQLNVIDSTSSFGGEVKDFATSKFWNQGLQVSRFNDEQFPPQCLPRLRKIKLNFREFLNSPESEAFMIDLLSMGINLQDFSFQTIRNHSVNPRYPNTSIISALSNKPNLDKLKGLRLHFDLSLEEIGQLIQLSERKVNRLALSKLSLIVPNNKDNVTAPMNKFLRLQSSSTLSLLKSLNIKIQPAQSDNGHSLHLPAMNELKSLQITTAHNTLKTIEFDGSFHTNFPGLKTLVYNNVKMDLANGQGELMSWFHPATFQAPHFLVSRLYIGYIHKASELVQLPKLFPNVVQLHIGLHSMHMVSHLWDSWSNLENLTLTLKKVDERSFYSENKKGLLLDEYITGIPKDYFKSCMAAYKASNYSLDSLNELKTQFRMLRGITHLKRLSHFELISESGGGISDVSIYFGLVSPNNFKLRSLVIGSGQISIDCRTYIRNQLGPQAYINFDPEVQKWCLYD